MCHVVSSLMFGGGQRLALELAARLPAERGIRTQLVLLGDRLAPEFGPIRHESIRLRGYDGRYDRMGSLARAALELRSVLRSSQVDIVHSHGWDCDIIAGLARAGSRVHQVTHQHILAEWCSSTRWVHHARRLLTRAVLDNRRTSWVAVSAAVKGSLDSLGWLPDGAIRVIRNGVDLDQFRPGIPPVHNPTPVIGVAARLATMKGLEYLLESIAALWRRGLGCQLHIAGEGPLRDSLTGLAQSLGVSSHVSFLGQYYEMPRFYRSLDVLVLPSISTEGLPLSILEGMATGLPVVSTRVSGIPEAVVDGVTGTLVAPRDAAALTAALEPFLRSRSLRRQMGRAGRRRVEREFSFELMASRIADVYREMPIAA